MVYNRGWEFQELEISVHHKEEYYRLILLSKNGWDVLGNNTGRNLREEVLSPFYGKKLKPPSQMVV